MKFEIKQQDLMTVDSKYVICHCISECCGMSGGVVIPIMAKYIRLKENCQKYVDSRGGFPVVGTAYRYCTKIGTVYNLFTKFHVSQHAGYKITVEEYHLNLFNCLTDMKNQMIEHGENFLAMPKIACGIDGCDWNDVEKIVKGVFKGTDIEILVCVL